MDIMNKKKARVIAFYLPQFHPIPENDKYWGKGFTEWTNVAKAKPLFKGHYQPRIPADLGFYDLRLPEVREAQAEMARNAGVEGFMYWHYWFGNGKMLLEKPFEEVLKLGKPDFPFCLGWANHDWTTKTWDKDASSFHDAMIAKVQYLGESDNRKHFEYVLPAFKDKRYITVDGKPFFMILNAFDFVGIEDFMNQWRTWAKEEGLEGVFFVAHNTGRKASYQKLIELGFDAVYDNTKYQAETAATGSLWKRRLKSLFGHYLGITLNKYDYETVTKYMITDESKLENCYPIITPGFDRTARAGRKASIYSNPTPEKFKKLVRRAIEQVQHKQDEHRIVILNSWNEWAEGNYMEPDLKFGHGYLDALKDEVFNK